MASISDLEVKVAVVNGDEIQREINGLRQDLADTRSSDWMERAGWMLVGGLMGILSCIYWSLK